MCREARALKCAERAALSAERRFDKSPVAPAFSTLQYALVLLRPSIDHRRPIFYALFVYISGFI
jgi:hypothetical protein